MIVKRATTAEEIAACLEIRRVVFIEGQNVPEGRERDDYDATATHFIASKDGTPFATARVVLKEDGKIGKIERVAVLEQARGNGVGKFIMQEIERAPELRGVEMLKLDSQTHALSFYEKLGYAPFGDEFMDAGIPHRHMKKFQLAAYKS
jgi:predicted GNAT family N-acyltransferase